MQRIASLGRDDDEQFALSQPDSAWRRHTSAAVDLRRERFLTAVLLGLRGQPRVWRR